MHEPFSKVSLEIQIRKLQHRRQDSSLKICSPRRGRPAKSGGTKYHRKCWMSDFKNITTEYLSVLDLLQSQLLIILQITTYKLVRHPDKCKCCRWMQIILWIPRRPIWRLTKPGTTSGIYLFLLWCKCKRVSGMKSRCPRHTNVIYWIIGNDCL